MGVVSSSASISACEKGIHWEGALELVQEMFYKLRRPNAVSCNAPICACEKGMQWETVLKLVQEVGCSVISNSAATSAWDKS